MSVASRAIESAEYTDTNRSETVVGVLLGGSRGRGIQDDSKEDASVRDSEIDEKHCRIGVNAGSSASGSGSSGSARGSNGKAVGSSEAEGRLGSREEV